MANIATVLVNVPVIQLNNIVYLQDGQLVPQTLKVPCRNVHVDTPYYWAVPIKDSGVFTTLEMIPQTDVYGNAVDQPTYDSFTVQRVRDKLSRYTWWIVIDDSASPPVDFTDVCATCCGEDSLTLSGVIPLIVPCQSIESTNDAGDFIVVFGAPALSGGQTYRANGAFNDEALVQVTAATLALLIVQMNLHWGTIGSPACTFVWTNVDLVVTGTGCECPGEICVLIEAV